MRAVASFPSVQSIHPKRLLVSIVCVHLMPLHDSGVSLNGEWSEDLIAKLTGL
jgi:hypothetical protein